MIPSQLQFLANHLWQSTLFAAVAGLLTLALRNNRAQTRYWVWLAASVKFLIPFSLLVDVGSCFGRHATPAITSPGLSYVIEQASQPFRMPPPLATIQVAAEASSVNWIPAVLCAFWAIGSATLIFSWWRRWRSLRAALRTASPLDLPIGIEAMTSPAFVEPGVFGIRRAVLLLPAGVTDRLTPAQLEAIVAHELCHVRRRDNLATAIHMGVEALFWFHPLVWWLGARLMEERERACDEEVLLMGSEPRAYAEGVLKICELYLESPLPCVAGVTGANLKKRIEEIMLKRIGLRLSFAKKIALAAAGVTVVTAPIAVGILNAPAIRAQSLQTGARAGGAATPKFEVASIKLGCGSMGGDGTVPKGRGGARRRQGQSPGRLNECSTVMDFIRMAYVEFANGRLHPPEPVPISGGPAWIHSDRYQINAKAEGTPSQIEMRGAMLRTLLEDRFRLKIHHETREVPVYALTVAKGGGTLQPSGEGSCIAPDFTTPLEPGQKPCGVPLTGIKGPNLTTEMVASLDAFSKVLGVTVGRPVIDKTGITGIFDLRLEFAIDEATPGIHPALSDEPPGPSIFTALQQQLGLKLVSAKGPGEFLIIDHVEKPSEN